MRRALMLASMKTFIRLAAVTACLVTFAPATASAAAPACSSPRAPQSTGDFAAIRSAVLCHLNAERTARGLPRLRAHPALRNSASRYARQMVRQQFFSHDRPGLVRRVRRTSFLRNAHHWSLGENLAWGDRAKADPQAIVQAWMASPPHRRNILTRRYRRIGVGVAVGDPVAGVDGGATYVTDFGTRRR
jgi:uncharacterized protein YkwD